MIQIYFNGFVPQYNTVETIGNLGDNKSETIHFIFNKVIDGVDISNLSCRCTYLNAEETGDVILLEPQVVGDKVTYAWVLEKSATAVKGKLQWQLSFLDAQTGYEKHTNVCKFKIGDSINVEEIIDVTPTLFQQLVQQCIIQADRAEAAADQVEEYVEEAKGYSEEAKEAVKQISEMKSAVEDKVDEASDILDEVTAKAETATSQFEEINTKHVEIIEIADQVADNKEAVDAALEEMKNIQEDVTVKHTGVTELAEQVTADKADVAKDKEQVREDRNTVLGALATVELAREEVANNTKDSRELLEQTQGQADNAKASAESAAESAKRAAETAAGVDAFFVRKYDKLPEVGEERTMYLIPSESPDGDNFFDEYIWFNDTGYEYVGNTKANLSDYATSEELDNKITMQQNEVSTPMDLVFKITKSEIVYNNTIKVSPYMGIRIVE